MAQRKTMESALASRFDLLDSEMPHLDDNDVWFYQYRLEHFIDISTNAEAAGRYKTMVRVLCAQARRALDPEDEKDDG